MNVNDKGTRYMICMQPRYNEILEKGKKVLRDWIGDNKENSGSTSEESRISREMEQGPILQ